MRSDEVVPEASGETSQIHIDRQAGDVLQFHSFYRDVRNQLAGANGWVENRQVTFTMCTRPERG